MKTILKIIEEVVLKKPFHLPYTKLNMLVLAFLTANMVKQAFEFLPFLIFLNFYFRGNIDCPKKTLQQVSTYMQQLV